MRKGYRETMAKRSHDDEGLPILGAPDGSSDPCRKRVAKWMIGQGFATGHGDTIEDLLSELVWQAQEMGD